MSLEYVDNVDIVDTDISDVYAVVRAVLNDVEVVKIADEELDIEEVDVDEADVDIVDVDIVDVDEVENGKASKTLSSKVLFSLESKRMSNTGINF